MLPKLVSKFFSNSFKEVLPALPVTDIIFAKVCSLLSSANLFKKVIGFFTFIIFFLFFLIDENGTMQPAPFLIAILTKLLPLLFFPLIVKNKLSFFIVLVSIRDLQNLNFVFYLKFFLEIIDFDYIVFFLKIFLVFLFFLQYFV